MSAAFNYRLEKCETVKLLDWVIREWGVTRIYNGML